MLRASNGLILDSTHFFSSVSISVSISLQLSSLTYRHMLHFPLVTASLSWKWSKLQLRIVRKRWPIESWHNPEIWLASLEELNAIKKWEIDQGTHSHRKFTGSFAFKIKTLRSKYSANIKGNYISRRYKN